MKFRLGILGKMIVFFVAFAFVPSVLIAAIFYRSTYHVLWENTVSFTRQLGGQMGRSLESVLSDAERFVEIGETDYVRSYLSGTGNQYENAKNILNALQLYKNNASFGDQINNIYIVGKDNRTISDRNGVYYSGENSLETIHFENILYSGAGEVAVSSGNMNPNPLYREETFVYIGIPLIPESLREPYGAVIIESFSDVFEDFCRSADLAGSGNFVIFDEEGQVLFGDPYVQEEDTQTVFQMISEDTAGDFITEIGTRSFLVIYNSIPGTSWKLVGQVAVDELMIDTMELSRTLTGVLALVMLCAAGLYFYFSNRLIRPLRKLQALMQVAALGNLSVRFESKVNDEIQDLGRSFNMMLSRLQTLTRRDLERQEDLQRMELDLLQAQIQPHFVYNTLDTILWQAAIGDNKAVIRTVDALGGFFRISLSKGKGWIPVSEEVKMVENYLIIQKTRYQDILNYSIQIDPALNHFFILKFTLQPLVENAIYHGIKQRREGGTVQIRGWSEGEDMLFSVSDDGLGMTKEIYQNITERLRQQQPCRQPSGENGYGLFNVAGRIKLYYGDAGNLTIESREGMGTTVLVRLKKEEGHV